MSTGEQEEDFAFDDDVAPASSNDLDLDDIDIQDLLRSALSVPKEDESAIRRNVQAQINSETEGRFFNDGWSTAENPRQTYLVTTAIMLLMVIVIWYLLAPATFFPVE